MIRALIGFLLPAAAAWMGLIALRLRRRDECRTLTAVAALALGIGLSSLTTFWLMAHCGMRGISFVVVDACLWTAAGAAAFMRVRRAPAASQPRADEPRGDSPVGIVPPSLLATRAVFGAVASIALATVATEYIAAPHGQWDAWAIWNQKARFLIRAGDQWTASLAVSWSNPSHPLLVPASVARLWAYAGAELTIVPAMLGLAFGVGIVAAVVGALAPRRPRAWIAGTVLVAPGIFVQQVAAQTADLPQAFFVTATLIMLRNVLGGTGHGASDARASLLLVGLFGSLAAWTKNEGLVLLAAVLLLTAADRRRHHRIRELAWLGAGAAIVLPTLAWLKLVIARVPPEYFAEAGTLTSVTSRLLDAERHAVIGEVAWRLWTHWGGPGAMGSLPVMMAAAVVAVSLRGEGPPRAMLATIVGLAAGYYAVWLLSPVDTVWLVSTSFDRLLVQIWPALILVTFSGHGPVQARLRLGV